MDYYSIAVGALAGGIGGAFIGRFAYKDKKIKSKLGLVFGLVLFSVVNTVGKMDFVKDPVMSLFDSNYRVKSLVTKELKALMQDKRVLDKLKTMNAQEGALYGRSLSKNGISKFNGEDLFLWNRLRLKLASTSDKVCSGLWTGKITEDNIYTALSSLSPKDIDLYIGMTKKAIDLELEGKPKLSIDPKLFQTAFQSIKEHESIEDGVKMDIFLGQGVNLSDEDACFMIKKLMKGVSKINKKEAEGMLKYWASL